jgi:hypothetical protein
MKKGLLDTIFLKGFCLLIWFVFGTFTAFTKQLATEKKWDAIVIGSGIGGAIDPFPR